MHPTSLAELVFHCSSNGALRRVPGADWIARGEAKTPTGKLLLARATHQFRCNGALERYQSKCSVGACPRR